MRIQRTHRLLPAAAIALAAFQGAPEALRNPFQRAPVDVADIDRPAAEVALQIAGEPLAGQRVPVAVAAPAGAFVRLWIEDPLGLAPMRSVEGVASERGTWSIELRAPAAGSTLRLQATAWSGSGPAHSPVVELTALAPYDPRPGDVVITEILAAPLKVADARGEWIEVYNKTSYDLDLEGWALRDDSGELHVVGESVLLASRTYGVLAIDGDPARNWGVEALYAYDSFFLDDVVDQVILSDVGETIDRVDYDLRASAPGGAAGSSLRVSGSALGGAANDQREAWCQVVPHPGGTTPGASNPCCALPSDEDVPDLDFLDTNCDGIDGDVARAVFVSPDGVIGNPGTMELPVPDIQSGILLASLSSAKDHVYVSEGTYVGTIVLADGVSIFGGYSASHGWERSGEHVTTIRAEVPVAEGMVAVQGTALSEPTTLAGLRVETADAPALSGLHNYAILLQQVPDARLEALVVEAGDGGSGLPGEDGLAGTNGNSGGDGRTHNVWVPGYWVFWFWVEGYYYAEYDWSGSGGSGAYGGGAGGDGGAWNGYDGDNGSGPNYQAPGGSGGIWIGGGYDGGNGSEGLDGVTPNTTLNWGFVASGLWVTDGIGTNGSAGGAGKGGGGGGGGSGAFGNALGHGGGGGGGGGWGGSGAIGGRPGGSSFALFLTQSSAALEACSLGAGDGAHGGDGGQAGPGGVGGAGGSSLSLEGRLPGGHGGRGGDGGHGAHGGGGGGGHSYGVLVDAASSLSLTASSVSAGAPGAGGISPETAQNPSYYGDAKDGKPGLAAAVREL